MGLLIEKVIARGGEILFEGNEAGLGPSGTYFGTWCQGTETLVFASPLQAMWASSSNGGKRCRRGRGAAATRSSPSAARGRSAPCRERWRWWPWRRWWRFS